MPYELRESAGRHCVAKTGGEILKCYTTKAAAKRYLRALYANVEDASMTAAATHAFQRSFAHGRDAAAERYTRRLERQYESALRANARRVAERYRKAAEVMVAAGEPVPHGHPTPDAATDEQALAESLGAKTQATRRGIVKTVLKGVGLTALAQKAHELPIVASVLDAQKRRTAIRAQQEITDKLGRVIEQAFVDGLSVDHTADAIQKELSGLARWQAVQYARTDLISLANGASYAGATVLGEDAPQLKVWVATEDERTRETHADADGQEVPIDQAFDVGGDQLMYPGDPDGSDEETINCRCTLIYTDAPIESRAHSDFGGIVEGLTEPEDLALGASASGPILEDEMKTQEQLTAATFTAKEREKDAAKGFAMPDGSFPIENRGQLADAIRSLGRAKPEDRAKVKAHIVKRAKALGATDQLPKAWSMTAAGFETEIADVLGDIAEMVAEELLNAAAVATSLNEGGTAAYLVQRASALCGTFADEDEGSEPAEPSYGADVVLSADASPLASVLQPVLANVVSMYLSAHGAHWNVTGSDFAEYHELFGEIYDDVYGSVDPIAENILKLGGRAPVGLHALTALENVPDVVDTLTPGSFAQQLVTVNDGVLASLQTAFGVANGLNEQGVANFLAERIDAHQKWRWQLRASLGLDATGDEQLTAGMEGRLTLAEESFAENSLTAAGAGLAPTVPPREWFDMPEADGPTALTITPEGQVYGHAALWDVCHVGIPGRCTTAPKSPTDYAFFHLGAVETDAGTVAVGKVTMDTGHAPLTASKAQAAAHYDHTGSVVAYVRAHDGEHGIWVTGCLRPDAPESKARALQAAALSGDWRQVNGRLEMVGLLAVNVPGFPVPRAQALAAGGAEIEETFALVAAGIPEPPEMSDAAYEAQLQVLGRFAE